MEYDLLLTDIELPGMSGLELTGRVRTRERERGLRRLPVIAATAHVGAEDRNRILSAGADVHLTKPFSIRDLEAALAAFSPKGTRETGPS